SESPHRDSFARSPLNETSFATNNGNLNGTLYSNNTLNASNSNLGLPHRPPSVSLPSVGQEGSEYADIDYDSSADPSTALHSGPSSPTQTRNIGSDLPLHAPKPSLSSSNAKARVATVTRSDSHQAAAAGIGKAGTPGHADDRDPYTRPLKSKGSFTRTGSSASTERPGSTQPGETELGIPEIGQRVPMYPNAGDVQAPSPSPFAQQSSTGIGFYNDGAHKPGRHHSRTRSGREVFQLPPGSYGLHGHGVAHPDKFEKAWYDKHPEALLREEHGQYGPGIGGGKGEWAMSSEDLNTIVRNTASRGPGFGTSPAVTGTPNEQIGYIASEEYALRMNSSRPQSATYHNKAHSNSSQQHIESSLRKTSFPVDFAGKKDFDKTKESYPGSRYQSDFAVESEAEDEDVIHVDPPSRRHSKYGGGGYDPPTEDLGPHGGNTAEEGGYLDERGYGVPILASDEVAKEHGSEYMQPAVSPPQERRGSTYFAESDPPPSYQSGIRSGSRPSSVSGSRPTSRPASIHGGLRFNPHDDREELHTPLEDVEEYEPLFPDEESKDGRPMTAADRFRRRPDMTKRRFPSQDIWEDTPNSLQLQTTVSTPEVQDENSAPDEKPASAVFEPPETESARKGEVSEEDKAKLIPKEQRWANSHFKPHLRDENSARPGMKQRFPSRDIWEDSPDSARLETTVGGPQSDELKSPLDEGLVAGAVVITAGRPEGAKAVDEGIGAATARMGATSGKPVIPPRPAKSKLSEVSHESAAPALPSIPARPPQRQQQVSPVDTTSQPKPSAEIQTKAIPAAEVSPTAGRSEPQVSPTEARKAPVLPDRPKPQVPVRPAKPVSRESSDDVSLTKTTSVRSATSVGTAEDGSGSPKDVTSPPALKPKPALPSRPIGGKIASLKAGFLSDLDKRLQIGPQIPKQQEKTPELDKEEGTEKAPLSDARKGRARGPLRRKPAASPSATAEETSATGGSKFEIAAPRTVWQISMSGDLTVASAEEASSTPVVSQSKVTQMSAPSLATNTAGEALHPSDQMPSKKDEALHTTTMTTNANQAHNEATQTSDLAGSSSKSDDATGELPEISYATQAPSGKGGTGAEASEQSPVGAAGTPNLTESGHADSAMPAQTPSTHTSSPTSKVEPTMQPSTSQTSEKQTFADTGSNDGQDKVMGSMSRNAPEEGDVVAKES
ncbi:MAG: hypothetical protein M1830_000708, partial [Pleopsidium flavum]